MTTKTTDTTNTAGSARTRRLTKKQFVVTMKKQRCGDCKHLDHRDALALGDGVGWCVQAGQYRHMGIKRACDSFTQNKNGG